MQSLETVQYHRKVINFDLTKLTADDENMSIKIGDLKNDKFIVSISMDYHFEEFTFEFEYYTKPKYIRREIREEVYRYFDYKRTNFNTRRFERVLRCFSKLDHRSIFESNIKSARNI